jgi:uncharacterized protein YjiS (DUF1127 family)
MDGSTWSLDQPPPQAAPRGRLLALLRRWRQRARERKLLAALDHRMLADIGITRIEQARECAKPFWRA